MEETHRSSVWRRFSPACCVALGALGVLLGACVSPRPATVGQLQTRAAFDLVCAPQQLQIYPLGARSRGVIGCGRRLAYVEVCDDFHGRAICSWMLSSPAWVQPTIAPAPTPSCRPVPMLVVSPAPQASASSAPAPSLLSPPLPPGAEDDAAVSDRPDEALPVPSPLPRSPARDFGF